MGKRRSDTKGIVQKKVKVDQEFTGVEVDQEKKNLHKYYAKIISKNTKNKEKVVEQALSYLSGDIANRARQHTVCRLLEVAIRYGNESQKQKVVEALREDIVELVEGKYSFFLAKQVAKAGDPQILDGVYASAKKLVVTVNGMKFLDYLYTKISNKAVVSAILGEDIPGSLNAIWKKIVKKDLVNCALGHYLAWENLQRSDVKVDLYPSLIENLGAYVSSKFGVRIALCLLEGVTKTNFKKILGASEGVIESIKDEETSAYLFFIKLYAYYPNIDKLNSWLGGRLIGELGEMVVAKRGVKFLLCTAFPHLANIFSISESEMQMMGELPLDDFARRLATLKLIRKELGDALCENLEVIIQDRALGNILIAYAHHISLGVLKHKGFSIGLGEIILKNEIMDNATAHRVLKKIVVHENTSNKHHFSKLFIQKLSGVKGLDALIKTKGVWVLCALVDSNTVGAAAASLLAKYQASLDPTQKGEKALIDSLTKELS